MLRDTRHHHPRTWLFVPGNSPARMEKALASASDAVILDLEDAVAVADKAMARTAVAAALAGSDRPQRHVRINDVSTPHALDDVLALAGALPTGLVVPKAESAEQVRLVAWLLDQVERRAGAPVGRVEIMPLLETARGVVAAAEIGAASPRVRQLAFGAGDMTLDLGIEWTRDEQELLPFRAAIVLASRQASLAAPVDAVWIRIDDEDGMAASAVRARDHGFAGKLCIHPRQIAAVEYAYVPDVSAVARAERIVAAFERGGQGDGGALRIDGDMVDRPVYEAAVSLLGRAQRGR